MSLISSFASFRGYVFGTVPCASAMSRHASNMPFTKSEPEEDLSEVYALLERFRAQQTRTAQTLASAARALPREAALHD